MSLLFPGALWWSTVLLAAVLLYLVRRRARPVPVTTLPFYQLLHRHLAESPWLRRLKRLLSFVLTAAVLAGAVLALARPVADSGDDTPGAVVVVVDRSASMGAVVEGGTVLARALARLRRALAAVPDHVPVTVLTSDVQPEVLAPFGGDRLAALRALEELAPRPVAEDHRHALALAAHLAATVAGGRVWWVGDAPPPPGTAIDRCLLAGIADPVNAGITACALRRLPQERNRLEAFIELRATCDGPVKLEVLENGELTALRNLEVTAGERRRLLLPVNAGSGGTLGFHLVRDGDVLGCDDRVLVAVPPAVRIRVDWVSPDPDGFTGTALATLPPEIEVRQFAADAWPPADPSAVLIAHRWYPAAGLPPAVRGVLCLDPPAGAGGMRIAAVPARVVEPPRVRRENHPLLFGVSSARLALAQTGEIADLDWLQPVWGGDAGTVLACGVQEDRRVVVMAFDPTRSPRLPLTASWPSLLANAVFHCAPETAGDVTVQRCGAVVDPGGDAVDWILPDGTREHRPAGDQVLLDRVGIWRGAGARGAAALLSPEESLLPAASAAAAEEGAAGGFVDWPRLLVLAVLGVLLAELWLLHRRGVF